MLTLALILTHSLCILAGLWLAKALRTAPIVDMEDLQARGGAEWADTMYRN